MAKWRHGQGVLVEVVRKDGKTNANAKHFLQT
jgi:hypothetical protein